MQDTADIEAFADIKRFIERWLADRAFRAAYPGEPKRVGEAHGLKVDPETVRVVWDQGGEGHADPSPLMRRYWAFVDDLVVRRHELAEAAAPADPRFAAWRQRQIHRLHLEVGVSLYPNPHIPASFELSRGCSVGCWFCSASPPSLSDTFLYTPQNARLWRGLLEALRDIAGPEASARSICYSGTDPLDNPDYERFADDFATLHDGGPFTSTALAVRDPERTRRLMARFGAGNMRFSVLSLAMLNKIHAAFTPEELLPVSINFRNEGSIEAKLLTFAGRARERAKTYRKYRPGDPVINTPSCETGFKFNLPDRVIRLSSPCAPDDRWPEGNRVYDEARFDDADDARRIMEQMIARHMPLAPPDDFVAAFQRPLRFEATVNGFALVGPHLTQRFENTPQKPFLGRLGEAISEGRRTVRDLTELVAREAGAPHEAVLASLNEFFRLGLLDDEPAVAAPVAEMA